MRTIFDGPLQAEMLSYMQFRQSVGFSTKNTAYIYADFDRYVGAHYSSAEYITRPMIVGYLATTSNLHSTSRGYHLTILRGLCRHLYQSDSRHYVPEPRLLRYGKGKLIPYIYSKEEIAEIIRRLRAERFRDPLMSLTCAVGVGLIAATGLRRGEVERLNLDDVDFNERVITIQRSKFFKSRLVPISESVADILTQYRELRLKRRPTAEPDAPFFIGSTGKRFLSQRLGVLFGQVVQELGLRAAVGGHPRLHDLRHTFATRWMEDLYRNGKDPNSQLPLLATYLGHVNLDHTQKYLHASLELLAQAGENFRNYSQVNRQSGVANEKL
ncbi:tyrosine-type recombinase/integrase [Bdellovibrionota bacterium FG-2]